MIGGDGAESARALLQTLNSLIINNQTLMIKQVGYQTTEISDPLYLLPDMLLLFFIHL